MIEKDYITIENNEMSLSQICQSGQCFRMKPLKDGWYEIIAGDSYLRLFQKENRIYFDCSQSEFTDIWYDYFDLATDYSQYIERINPRDHYLVRAADCGKGVRILRQDLWEMIVSFLISQQNNIKRIRHCIDLLCQTYGKACRNHYGDIYYTFPGPEALALPDQDALKACNLGYRSKYVIRTAHSVVAGDIDLEEIAGLPYPKAKKALMECYGTGEKVADCICLFSLHHLQAFPVDTHIKQVLEAHYKRGFPNRRYKDCRGVLQQYIFYYDLNYSGGDEDI